MWWGNVRRPIEPVVKNRDARGPPVLAQKKRVAHSSRSLLDESARWTCSNCGKLELSHDVQSELQSLRAELQHVREFADCLTDQLSEKDEAIARLNKGTALNGERLVRLNEHVHVAIQRIFRDSDEMILQEAWVHWRRILEEKRAAKQCNEQLSKATEVAFRKAARAVNCMCSANVKVHAKAVLEVWSSIAYTNRMQRAHHSRLIENLQKSFDISCQRDEQLLMATSWASWHQVYQEGKKEGKLEADWKEHIRTARDLRKEMGRRTAMALACKADGVRDSCTLMLVFQLWMGFIEAQKRKEVEAERIRVTKERHENSLHANFVLLSNTASHVQLAALFETWRNHFQKHQYEVEVSRLKTLNSFFGEWRLVTKNNRSNRELEKLQKEQNELQMKHEEELAASQTKRSALLKLTGASNETGLLAFTWSAWRELITEAIRRRQLEQQKLEWEREWKERQQRALQQQRIEQVGIALVMQDHGVGAQLLLHMAWSGWVRLMLDITRERQLDGAQRLYEDEMKQLLMETTAANERYNEALNLRKLAFLACSSSKDDDMLLQFIFQAWSRSWYDCHKDQQRAGRTMALVACMNVKDADMFVQFLFEAWRRSWYDGHIMELQAAVNATPEPKTGHKLIVSLSQKSGYLCLQMALQAWKYSWHDRQIESLQEALKNASAPKEAPKKKRNMLRWLFFWKSGKKKVVPSDA